MSERGVPRSLSAPGDLVPVAKVAGAYGIKGWVKLSPENSPANSVLLNTRRCWLQRGDDAPRPVQITASRAQGHSVVAGLSGLADRETADRLRGQVVLISRADFPPPAAGEFYWVDLIGCEVRNRSAVLLGRVETLVDHGAHAILVVSPAIGAPALPDAAPQILIPFVEKYLLEVDLASRRIQVDWEFDF